MLQKLHERGNSAMLHSRTHRSIGASNKQRKDPEHFAQKAWRAFFFEHRDEKRHYSCGKGNVYRTAL